MKIKTVNFCNRKKRLFLKYTNNKVYEVHYSELGLDQKIINAWVDKETKAMTAVLMLEDNSEEYLSFDQPLYLRKDPEYMLRLHIERVIADIKMEIKHKKISIAYLRDKLQTSDSQIRRLLDPSNLNKNLTQLYKIADILGLNLKFGMDKEALAS